MKFHPVNPKMEEVSWQLFLDEANNTLYDGTYSHEYKSEKITDFEKLLIRPFRREKDDRNKSEIVFDTNNKRNNEETENT